MQTFEQFYTETVKYGPKDPGGWYGGNKRKRFEPGEIVLVSTQQKSGTTVMNKPARSYMGKIGVVTGHKARSMASPYINVKFDDGNEVPIIALFLRGPYKDKATAQKYQADPSLKDSNDDLTFVNAPLIRPALLKYGRNYKIESDVQKAFGSEYVWLDEPVIITKDDASIDFGVARCPFPKVDNFIRGSFMAKRTYMNSYFVDHQGVPCLFVKRRNDKKKHLMDYTIDSVQFDIPRNETDLDDVRQFVQWMRNPFSLVSLNTKYGAFREPKNILQVKMFREFLDTTEGKTDAQYMKFFLGNSSLKELLAVDYQGRNYVTNWNRMLHKAFVRAGMMKPEAISDELLMDIL